MKILFAVSECMPFCATGGLAEVAGSLPAALAKKKNTVKVIMPLYKRVIDNYSKELEFIGKTNTALSWRNQYCGLFRIKKDGVEYYFIDNKYYFDRDMLYSYYDDGERFAFFSKAVFDCLEMIKFYPDIIHANDHQTALVNIYLDSFKRQGRFLSTKSVFTIHNIEYQGQYDNYVLGDLFGLGWEYREILENNKCVNLLKGAIVTSDAFTTVSPRYAKEITTGRYGKGLEYIINTNRFKLTGILNGINYDFYNPEKDTEIIANYNYDTYSAKLKNKRHLQKEYGLNQDDNVCLIAIISRLVGHKGMDLVVEKMDEMVESGCQFIILGMGDPYFEDKFNFFSYKYPGRVCFIKAFNTPLSKQIYSGADLFLMPSLTEPCGLSQMIACRYGTLPIVHATGGLADSISDANGFVFKAYDANEMAYKVKEAINVYNHKDDYMKMVHTAMYTDFSWANSAKKYLDLYKSLLERRENND